MTNRIENAYEGFTKDVITLLTIGGRSSELRPILEDVSGDLPAFIRSGVVDSLAPIMRTLPPFVQQVVARALVDHVDWQTVAAVVATNPEEN
jgi:hypothetical protein